MTTTAGGDDRARPALPGAGELGPVSQRGMFGAYPGIGVPVGSILATGMLLLMTSVTSPVFQEMQERKRESSAPLRDLIAPQHQAGRADRTGLRLQQRRGLPADRVRHRLRHEDPVPVGMIPMFLLVDTARIVWFAVGYALGAILGGAFAPAISELLVQETGTGLSIAVFADPAPVPADR